MKYKNSNNLNTQSKKKERIATVNMDTDVRAQTHSTKLKRKEIRKKLNTKVQK